MSVIAKNKVSRISVSLPASLLRQFDDMLSERGFKSRSQAIAEMINERLAEYRTQLGDEIMAGVITLVYDHSRSGLQKQLADLQHRYLDEVISSLHVQLMRAHTMEVVLVQGPAVRLQRIADDLVTCRGVISGKLQLSAAILPPVHPFPESLVKEREMQT
ncbi:MAG: nickel-responsive transcriptional regulator NikR [Thiogranum sp.]